MVVTDMIRINYNKNTTKSHESGFYKASIWLWFQKQKTCSGICLDLRVSGDLIKTRGGFIEEDPTALQQLKVQHILALTILMCFWI